MTDEDKTREQLLAEIAELHAEVGRYRGLLGIEPAAGRAGDEPAEVETARWLTTLLAGLSSAEIGIDIVSADREILFQNRWLESLFPGRTGDICHRVYVERDEPCVDCPMEQALRSGETASGVIEGADGRQYLVVASLLPTPEGEAPRVLEVVFDVTERVLAERTARAERDRAQRYLDIAGVMLVAIGADERVELINQKGAALLGGSVGEIVGANWFDRFVPEDQRGDVRRVFGQLMRGEIEPVERYENHVLTSQGDLRLIAWHNTVLRDDDGRITGTLSSGDDVTSRRAVVEALRRSEELNRTVLESIPEGMVTIDLAGTITYASPATARLYGVADPGEVVGKNAFGFFIPADLERGVMDMRTVLERERLLDREFELVRKDGSTYPAEVSAALLRDADGAPAGIVAIFRDITERKRGEEALRRSEEAFRNIAERSIDVVFTLGVDGQITYTSPSLHDVLGFRPGEVAGRNVVEFILESQRPMALALIQTIASGQAPSSFEIPCVHRDGKTVQVEIRAALVAEGGRPQGIQGVMRDVTVRRKWEQRLRSLASDLSLAAEKERRRIAIELHDQVGQTLAVANLKLGVLREEAQSGDLRGRLDEIRNHWQTAMAYTRSLTAELSPPVLYELGFEAAVEWLVERQKVLREDLELRFEDDGSPKPLSEDARVTLFQAVRELLVNVIKHAGASTAEVSLCREGDDIRISVEDDGVGFDVGARKASGDEFGLYSIGERLRAIGGAVEIESEPGHGTRIVLRAPLAK